MELVELKNDEQFVKKFKDEENLLNTWRGAVKYPNLQKLPGKTFFLEALTCAKQDFQEWNTVYEEQVPNPIVRQQSAMWTTTYDIQRAT